MMPPDELLELFAEGKKLVDGLLKDLSPAQREVAKALLKSGAEVGARYLRERSAKTAGSTPPPPSVDQRAEDLMLLGLDEGASAEQIRTRYKALAQIYHPDKGGSKESFARLQGAYSRLTK
jgi:DnaJ-like protein